MTPKEKAIWLYHKFWNVGCRSSEEAMKHSAKQSAMIAAELVFTEYANTYAEDEKYWALVRQEIDKL